MTTFVGLKSYILFDARVVFRERLMIVLILALPALFYLFFGLMFGNASYNSGSGTGSADFYNEYTPSFTGLILLNVALMNVAPVLVIYKELGFFRRLMVTPLDMSSIWISAILRSFVIFLIGYLEMMILGWLMFDRVPDANLIGLFASITVSAFALFSMGFMIGSLLKSANAAFNAGILIFQPMLLLSGASFPMEMFPNWLRYLTEMIPMTHVVRVMRLAWQDLYLPEYGLWSTIYLLIFGTICALISRATFRTSAI